MRRQRATDVWLHAALLSCSPELVGNRALAARKLATPQVGWYARASALSLHRGVGTGPHRAFGDGGVGQPRTSDAQGAMSEAGWSCQVHSPISRCGAAAPRRVGAICARARQKELSMSNIL